MDLGAYLKHLYSEARRIPTIERDGYHPWMEGDTNM